MPQLSPLILAYHGVAPVRLRHDPYRLFTAPAALAQHIDRLRRWGYQLVSFGELVGRLSGGDAGGCAAMTFDDGFSDNLHTLAPLLLERRVPATVFVVSTWDGIPHPDAPWARTMTSSEVRELSEAGVEIGSHSSRHRDLSTVPYEEALDDLKRSRDELAELIDRPVQVASYPFGRASDVTRRACRDAGFVGACRTSGQGSWDDPWDLPRQDMVNCATMLGLRMKRDDRYEPFVRTLPGRAIRAVFRRAEALVR